MNPPKSPQKLALKQETIRLLNTFPQDEGFNTALVSLCKPCNTRQLGCTI